MPKDLELELIKKCLAVHTERLNSIDKSRDEHFIAMKARHDQQDADYKHLMEAVDKITESTQGLVDAVWVVCRLRKFAVWLSGFAFLAGIAAWLLGKLPEIPHP